MPTPATRRALAPALLVTLFALPAAAQQRPFSAQPPAADVKTAREPSRVPDAPIGATIGARAERPSAPDRAALPDAAGLAQQPAVPSALPRRIDRTRMHWDAPGDGSLWARGTHYKMSFDERGATYYPLFGAAQEHHYPLALSPQSAARGGVALDLDFTAQAVRSGDRVEIDRGAFIEVYELRPESIEQLFVLPAIAGSGELLVTLPLTGAFDEERAAEVHATETAAGLELRTALGHVTYGRAVAVQADGRRTPAATQLERGSVTIRLEHEFLQGAALPLVIDPVVSTFPIDTTSFNDASPDLAYDAQTQRWLVVFDERAAAGDWDAYYTMCNAAGTPMWGAYLNLTTASWKDVRCANMYLATQFLAVANVAVGSTESIRGRTIEADIAVMGGEIAISGSESGAKYNVTVGGDPFGAAPVYYCVAWEREYATDSDYDIHAKLVGSDGSLGALIPLSNSGLTEDQRPSISKANGAADWTIVWQRDETSTSTIWGARVRYDGIVTANPFQISAFNGDYNPSVSSPLLGSRRTMVAYERSFGTDSDIVASILDGTAVIQEVNLSLLESDWLFLHQHNPSVDSDGQHFLVGYVERPIPSAVESAVYCSDFHLSGNTLGLSQKHMPLSVGPEGKAYLRIASARGSGGPGQRFMAIWYEYVTNGDIYGGLIDALAGGSVTPFCLGDGTNGACPCGNNGAPGHGCGHSHNPAGAVLSLSGTPSTWSDTAVLSASGLPGATLCIFLQSQSVVPALPFSDGIGCLTGSTLRLAGKNATMGSVSYPDPLFGNPLLHNAGNYVGPEGGTRTYQVWYRNSPSFCTSAPSNITNGLIVNWAL